MPAALFQIIITFIVFINPIALSAPCIPICFNVNSAFVAENGKIQLIEIFSNGFPPLLLCKHLCRLERIPNADAGCPSPHCGRDLAYVSCLPEEFAANKGSYYRFGFGLLQPNFHLTAHAQQIKDAISAARK